MRPRLGRCGGSGRLALGTGNCQRPNRQSLALTQKWPWIRFGSSPLSTHQPYLADLPAAAAESGRGPCRGGWIFFDALFGHERARAIAFGSVGEFMALSENVAVTLQINPLVSKIISVEPLNCSSAPDISRTPNPRWVGCVTAGPPVSRQNSSSTRFDMDQCMETTPLSSDRAPYFAALVASS
jgi:hypothetical protein